MRWRPQILVALPAPSRHMPKTKRPAAFGRYCFGEGTNNAFALRKFEPPMSLVGVRREKAALSSGCKSHPANAPAGSNRSSHGGNEVAEAFD